MNSQATQKATHNVHSNFREFYPGNRVLVKDLRKEDTWWPGSVAERSKLRSHVIVLKGPFSTLRQRGRLFLS